MAASMAFSRQVGYSARILRGISYLVPRASGSCSGPFRYENVKSSLPLTSSTLFHSASTPLFAPSPITVTEEPDTLFQKISILVKGHDWAVLDSYQFFATMAAKELGITLSKVSDPPKDIERLTVLKSVHIFKKHRVQYEMRTHYRCFELSRITGSTAQVYLEYIQRNLPEGVAMEVKKTAMEKIPDHILEPMWKDKPNRKPSQ